MTLKVSVVIATYRSGDGLNGLVASLDAQTLPKSEFEVIFVDDGSPDDTYTRLERIRDARQNVRIARIDNSGWASRPRNVGTDMALGEYVAYMDHDDQLYPDALRAAYEYAVLNGADVVNGKEARTHDSAWAIEAFRRDLPQAIGHTNSHPLIPTNPHKLYRRAFLQEHAIRFPEGSRVLWEDIFFNIQASRWAKVISTLASVPYYHWVATKGSGSTTFLRSRHEWWQWLRKVIESASTELAGDALEVPRVQMMRHQYRSRLIDAFNGQYAKRPQTEQDLIFDEARAIQADYFSVENDVCLAQAGRRRAQLLRAGDQAGLTKLTVDDPHIWGWASVEHVEWRNGALHLSATARWQTKEGRRHHLARSGDRIVAVLPDDLKSKLPEPLLDETEEVLGAAAEFGVRSRKSRVTWMLTSTSAVTVTDTATGVEFEPEVEGTFDPMTTRFGRSIEGGIWDVNVRCTFGGTSQQPRLRSRIAPVPYFYRGNVWCAYSTADGYLAVDFDQKSRPIAAYLAVDADRPVAVHRSKKSTVVKIFVRGVAVDGETDTRTHLDVCVATKPKDLAHAIKHRIGEATGLSKRPEEWERVGVSIRSDGVDAWVEVPVRANAGRLLTRIGSYRESGEHGEIEWEIDLTKSDSAPVRRKARKPRAERTKK